MGSNPIRSTMEQIKPYCCYCGKEIVLLSQLTKEHLVPRSWGGNSSLLNVKDCCFRCNQKRSNKPLKKWLIELHNELVRNKHIKSKRYDLSITIENVSYWINYIELHNVNLYRPQKQWLIKNKEAFGI